MSSLWIFAARGNPELQAIGALILIIACVVTLIGYGVHAIFNELSVDTKRGVPYCRGCGRQVSYRRDHCRACGLSLYVPRQPDQESPDHVALREAERLAARAARRDERDAAYRARGIEPGPWAWFRALPEVTQAILLGLAVAAPAVAVAVAALAPRATAPVSAAVGPVLAPSPAAQDIPAAPPAPPPSPGLPDEGDDEMYLFGQPPYAVDSAEYWARRCGQALGYGKVCRRRIPCPVHGRH